MLRFLFFPLVALFCLCSPFLPVTDLQGATVQPKANPVPQAKKTAGTAATVKSKQSASTKSSSAQTGSAAKSRVPSTAATKKTVVKKTTATKTSATKTTAKKTTLQKTGATPSKKATAATAPANKASVAKAPARKPAAVSKRPARTVAAAAPLAAIEKQISSKSVMVMDADTGETIFAKAPDAPRQPASTIKIVTGMIALKSLTKDDKVAISRYAADMPSSKVYLDVGRQYLANDLIDAVLLSSANDASVALAERIAGSEARFANLMTLSARMWGAKNTVCRTASGLTAEGQQSTARDLATLFRAAMQNQEFARRMCEKRVVTSYGKTLYNHNKALWRVDGTEGGKTGYTVAARQTYVGQFSRGEDTIIVAIMGSETMWADLKKLVDYGFVKKKEATVARTLPVSDEADTARLGKQAADGT